MAGEFITAPRCLKPMRQHGPESDPYPVCYRPEGHTPNRCLSRRAYLRELERGYRNKQRRRENVSSR